MRALVVTSNPATAASEPETPAAALSDLGCEVVAVGYDVDQLPEDIELQRPSVVVVDAGAHLEVGRAAIRRVREVGSLADVPVLLCVEVSRLAGLDPEAGADDFVLSPVVAPELYARIRQLDWRMSSFRAAGRIKIGDLVIDAVAVEAAYRGRALKLPRQEFQLLKFLAGLLMVEAAVPPSENSFVSSYLPNLVTGAVPPGVAYPVESALAPSPFSKLQ
jgi:DNA-binding response OmpR family regulator